MADRPETLHEDTVSAAFGLLVNICTVFHMANICTVFHMANICTVFHMGNICTVFHMVNICTVFHMIPTITLFSHGTLDPQWARPDHCVGFTITHTLGRPPLYE